MKYRTTQYKKKNSNNIKNLMISRDLTRLEINNFKNRLKTPNSNSRALMDTWEIIKQSPNKPFGLTKRLGRDYSVGNHQWEISSSNQVQEDFNGAIN